MRKPRLINDVELMAIYGADEVDRGPLFIEWLTERGRPAMRAALRRIADRRGLGYLAEDHAFAEDVLSWASFAAWEAIVGYRWFCPTCREDRLRKDGTKHGTKLCRSYASDVGLRRHAQDVHGEDLAAPAIGRRTMYMIGSCIQGALRKRARYVARFMAASKPTLAEDPLFRPVVAGAVTGSSALPIGRRSIEVEDASALEKLAALERRLDRERAAVHLAPLQRQRASCLLSGVAAEDVIRVSSSLAGRSRKRHTRRS